MNENEQRTAIAEFQGWKSIRPDAGGTLIGYPPNKDQDGWPPCPVPDYLNDLNAMHEAEEHLHGREQLEMWNDNFYVTPRNLTSDEIGDWPCHSTAAQRAEALLRTIGKWKEL